MTQFSYPTMEHRPTPATPSEVLADELQTYRTPEEFGQFLTYLQRSYGRTALARAMLDDTRRLAVSDVRLLTGGGSRKTVAREHMSLYSGALISMYTHTRGLSSHKQVTLLTHKSDDAIEPVANESPDTYRNRLAAYYLDLREVTQHELEVIYDEKPELAELLEKAGKRVSDKPELGAEYSFAVEEGLLYGGFAVESRAEAYDYFFPNGNQMPYGHYSA